MQIAASEPRAQDRASRLPERAAPDRLLLGSKSGTPTALQASQGLESMFPHISCEMVGFKETLDGCK